MSTTSISEDGCEGAGVQESITEEVIEFQQDPEQEWMFLINQDT